MQTNSFSLMPGDIVIASKDWYNPMAWFGHSAVVIDQYRVAEYAQPFFGYYETPMQEFLQEHNGYSVLRYKHFTPEFKSAFFKNFSTTKDKKYAITHKADSSAFYCSQYIWYLYYQSAKDLGYKLDIDRDGGFLVTPYDLLTSSHFTKIDF